MMNPFEFAKRLHRYLSGEASAEEREEVERQLAADPEMADLATELQDKKRISAELQVMASFDTERALKDGGGAWLPLWLRVWELGCYGRGSRNSRYVWLKSKNLRKW